MTPEQAKLTGQAVEAFILNKPIQYQCDSGVWLETCSLDCIYLYPHRPKPEPKTRLWNKREEVPWPCWLRFKGERTSRLMLNIDYDSVCTSTIRRFFYELGDYEWSQTHSGEFKPCTVVDK